MLKQVFISAALIMAAPAALAGPEAEAVIQDASDQLVDGTFTAGEMTKAVDTQLMAHFTLGKYVRRASSDELESYEASFKDLLVKTFNRHSDNFVGAEIAVLGSTDRGDNESIVDTEVTIPGEEQQNVSWRLLEREGEWRVVDIKVHGLWFSIEQRAQISSILDRSNGDFNEAIESIRKGTEDFADVSFDTLRNG